MRKGLKKVLPGAGAALLILTGGLLAGAAEKEQEYIFPDTDKETMATIIKRYADQDTWKKDLVFEQNAYELLLDILDESGQLSERPEYSRLVTTEYVKE